MSKKEQNVFGIRPGSSKSSETKRKTPYKSFIQISQIHSSDKTQSRVKLNQSVLEDYTQLLNDSDFSFPPISVLLDNEDETKFYIYDGYHRLEAHKRKQRNEIFVEVTGIGNLRDAILQSLSVNSEHGLRRSNADKRKAVMTLLTDKDWNRWSNNQIAKHCKVDEKTVRNIRKRLETDSKNQTIESTSERTYTRNGKVQKMKFESIGKKGSNKEHTSENPKLRTSSENTEYSPRQNNFGKSEVKPSFLTQIPFLKAQEKQEAIIALTQNLNQDLIQSFIGTGCMKCIFQQDSKCKNEKSICFEKNVNQELICIFFETQQTKY